MGPSPEARLAKTIEAMTPGVKRMNAELIIRYGKDVETYLLNKTAGHPPPIPEPEMAYDLTVNADGDGAIIGCGKIPVCEPDARLGPPAGSTLIAGLGPMYAPGKFLTKQGDNAPAGYRAHFHGPEGPEFEKKIDFSTWYEIVR